MLLHKSSIGFGFCVHYWCSNSNFYSKSSLWDHEISMLFSFLAELSLWSIRLRWDTKLSNAFVQIFFLWSITVEYTLDIISKNIQASFEMDCHSWVTELAMQLLKTSMTKISVHFTQEGHIYKISVLIVNQVWQKS